jgi:hypothetical protein
MKVDIERLRLDGRERHPVKMRGHELPPRHEATILKVLRILAAQ